jgi:hypothetical protein
MAVTTTEKYLEIIESTSPTSYSWAVDGANARVTYIVAAEDFYGFVTYIMGGVRFNENNKMIRQIPLSLPEYPWLYATRITSFQGLSIDGRSTTDSFALFDAFYQLDKSIPRFAGVYRQYRFTVEYTTRPYRIISQEQIESYGNVVRPQYFIQDNPAGPVQSVNVPFTDTFEWCRYITVDETPKPELLANNLGKWCYRTINGVDNTGPVNFGALTTQDGSGSNLLITKSEVKVKWWFIPWSIINNINFYNAYNKINSTEFLWFPAGSLLFKNLEINSYSSPYPIENINYSVNPELLMTSYLRNRYCDLTFVFERLVLPESSIGTLPTADYNNINGKIRAGHNCMPFSGNLLYYYTETQPPTNNNLGLPIYWSYDMRQLFSYNPYIQP